MLLQDCDKKVFNDLADEMKPFDLDDLLNLKQYHSLNLIRTKEEYAGGHIENSILLPVTEIPEKAETVLTDKEAKILVYCRSGNRSANASRELIKMGYTKVYDFGGIISWPYEIIK